ncbi:hypothetical protein PFISCL1PPCAC_19115 [Pristionchus fissidentatus]|uniref:Chitin-binding type-2 domain-containing protein n=1 Tax=Pristionchus fissidentatus TaxID=1538716 RepID=A0AAV5WAU6_9BILA|nr:hypothetical protein PFISCL1PPCAC_19115 [Pristionchus fissidentatus]
MLTVSLFPLLVGVCAALASAGPPGYYPVESYPIEESTVRASCTKGVRRRFDYSQCAEYEECVLSNKRGDETHWEKKKCFDGYSFNDSNGNCQIDEKCATVENKCDITYFRLSCSELLVCAPHNGAYVRTNCDDGFRNDFNYGCVADARCSTNYKNETCKEGDARPTANCRTYSICEKGVWTRKQCKEMGRFTEWCSECDPQSKPRECNEGDSRPVNRTDAFEGYGIDTSEIIDCVHYQSCEQGKWTPAQCAIGKGYDPSAKRCTRSRLHKDACNPPITAPRCEEGARLVPPHSCSRFLQCDRGEWRQMACPIKSRFDANANRCVEGECRKHPDDKGNGDANYQRNRHHKHHHRHSHGHSDESSSEEQLDFQQRPIEIQSNFPQQSQFRRRLNGAPEPFLSVQHQPLPPPSSHRPGYLGQPENPQPVFIPSRPLYPLPPLRPYPAPQPYPIGPTHPHHPAPAYPPAQYPSPVPTYPAPPAYPSAPSYPVASPATPVYQEGTEVPRLPGLICEGDFKVADAFDSAYYYDCIKGYLKRRACPVGSRFDPQRSRCLNDYTWKADVICYDNQVMPTAYCGEYKICQKNEWLSGLCPHDFPFINGQCDKRKSCRDYARPPTTPHPTCAPGSVRPDFANPLGYLECDYNYNWVKRNCEHGGVFDKRISRCVYTTPSHPAPPSVPSYPQPEYKPVCYEGEMKKDDHHCTKYEVCHSGRFEPRYCPYGSGFNGYHCEPGYRCQGEAGHEGTCQESAGLKGFLPDRIDCAYFYQCAQGRWIRMPCAPGTHYNPQIGVCDHIGNVPGCGWSGPRPTHY